MNLLAAVSSRPSRRQTDDLHRVSLLTSTVFGSVWIRQDFSPALHPGCRPVTDLCCQVRAGRLFFLSAGALCCPCCRLEALRHLFPLLSYTQQVGAEEPVISCCFGTVPGDFRSFTQEAPAALRRNSGNFSPPSRFYSGLRSIHCAARELTVGTLVGLVVVGVAGGGVSIIVAL